MAKESSCSSCWEEIPLDLVGTILSRLSLADHIRFSVVCTSWMLAASEHPLKSKTPWLMLAGGGKDQDPDDQDYRHLCSLHDQRTYRIHLPGIRGWKFLGSCDEWLVAIDDRAQLHILNPFTGFQPPLPPTTAFSCVRRPKIGEGGRIIGYYVKDGYFRNRAVLQDMEYMLKFFFAKVIYFPSASITIAIQSVHRELAFARTGDNSWTQLELKEEFCCFFDDVILHKGIFYAVTITAYTIGFDLSNGKDLQPKITFEGPDGSNVFFTNPVPHYLVESKGDLLLISREVLRVRRWSYYRHNCNNDDKYYYRTKTFKVYRLDPVRFKWVKLKSLGEMAIFVGYNHSISLSAKDSAGLKPNCIYFTENCVDQIMHSPHNRRDIGVFHLEDGSIDLPRGKLRRLNWPPPIWFTPSLS